jgi:uncharacterized protein YjhX (UPF0386 family)
MSKGSWKRPVAVSHETYSENWDRIFGKSADDKSYMIKLKGETQSFHCNNREGPNNWLCGCNVFHKDKRGRYICNACGAAYVGDK